MNAAPGKSYPSRRRGPQAKTLTAFLRAMSSRMACRTPSAAKCARNEIDRVICGEDGEPILGHRAWIK